LDGPSGSPDGAYGSVQQRGTGAAPRGQLPYIDDDGEAIGDSDAIIAHLTRKYRLTIDDGLTAAHVTPIS
jgi:hypothetical protein